MLKNKVMVPCKATGIATWSVSLKKLQLYGLEVVHQERTQCTADLFSGNKSVFKISKPDHERRLEGVSGAGFNLSVLSYCKITKEFYFPMLSF